MRVPNFQLFAEWLQGIGIFIAGMIVGAAVFMAMYVENFDYLVQQNEILKEDNEQLKEQLENHNLVKNPTQLKAIDISIHNPPSYPDLDDLTITQLQKLAREELKFMIGQEIKRLEPEHIKRLFGKKVFALEDGKASYVVEINSIFIADTEMRIWLWANRYMPAS
ncbi:hypothetical protein PRECH8_13870 [Insulibacter thermoxylanivorax]|uniref:Sporulation membrane protein YtrI C-terminal domain-containing protein n=1 Tax=Insulibacter thermoxylanivorax TaxID=2749268 RepID=A0A916VG35_9BACL|nr:hypothetical protein [Insulibacter thermoxylanivorax]GFR38091.1 hypothetical protein PRECH8_13870 [Insulibacter thermoxylanivorax]